MKGRKLSIEVIERKVMTQKILTAVAIILQGVFFAGLFIGMRGSQPWWALFAASIVLLIVLWLFQKKKVSYFENFIQSYHGKAEDTREDVESIWNRMKVLLDSSCSSLASDERSEDLGNYVEHVPSLMNTPDGCGRVSGLVVGRVQSGKTRNYVGLMLKAFDEGWNTVLVLTSNNKMLAHQTWTRLLGAGSGEGDLCKRGKARTIAMSKFDKNQDGEVEFAWMLADGEWREGNLYVGVIQKEDDHFKKVEHWLRTVGEKDGGKLAKKMRMLVIDDEADNATPDSSLGRRDLSLSEADVVQIAGDVKASLAEEDVDVGVVSNWILSLSSLEIGRTEANEFLSTFTNPYQNVGDFKRKVLDPKAAIYSALGFSKPDESGGGFTVGDHVDKFFAGRKTKNNPIRNSRTLIGLILYALEYVPQRSTISRYICSLTSRISFDQKDFRFAFANLAYIGYTATPFANMLNEDPKKDPIAPDFIKSLKVSDEYFGLERLHGKDSSKRIDIVREIPINEEVEAIAPITEYDWVDALDNEEEKPDVAENLVVKKQTQDRGVVSCEWKSMRRAIAWLFCAAAARKIIRERNSSNERASRWSTMIVNISHAVSVHAKLRGWLSAYVQYAANNRDNFLRECEEIWMIESKRLLPIDKFKEQCAPAFYTLDNGIPGWYPKWRMVKESINWFLSQRNVRVHVIELNSTAEGKRWQTAYATGMDGSVGLRDDHIWLICGGNTISRGLTLDGLVASYFDRIGERSCVDTVTQMGRWFGYRKGYELLPRVWMTANAMSEMMDIAEIEQEMHINIARQFDRACSPKNPAEYAVVKYLGMRLTGRDAAMALSKGVGLMDHFGCVNVDSAGKMTQKVRGTIDRLTRVSHVNDDAYSWQWNGRRPCPCYKGVKSSRILTLLEGLKVFYAAENRSAIEGLIRAVGKSPSVNWDIVIENPGRQRDGRQSDVSLGVAYSLLHHVTVKDGSYQTRTQAYGAWFADIPNDVIAKAECGIARNAINTRVDLSKELRQEIDSEVSRVEERIGRNDSSARLSFNTRKLLGFDKGSRGSYIAAVYEAANRRDPVLHITVAKVLTPDGRDESAPIVLLSYFWPDHRADLVASPRVTPSIGYGDVVRIVKDYFSDNKRITSIQGLRDAVKGRFDGADASESMIRAAVRACANECGMVECFDDPLLRGPIIYGNAVGRGANPIDGVRNFLADAIAREFLDQYAQDGTISCRKIYSWLENEFPGCIKGNNVFNDLCRPPWFDSNHQQGLLNSRGIQSLL